MADPENTSKTLETLSDAEKKEQVNQATSAETENLGAEVYEEKKEKETKKSKEETEALSAEVKKEMTLKKLPDFQTHIEQALRNSSMVSAEMQDKVPTISQNFITSLRQKIEKGLSLPAWGSGLELLVLSAIESSLSGVEKTFLSEEKKESLKTDIKEFMANASELQSEYETIRNPGKGLEHADTTPGETVETGPLISETVTNHPHLSELFGHLPALDFSDLVAEDDFRSIATDRIVSALGPYMLKVVGDEKTAEKATKKGGGFLNKIAFGYNKNFDKVSGPLEVLGISQKELAKEGSVESLVREKLQPLLANTSLESLQTLTRNLNPSPENKGDLAFIIEMHKTMPDWAANETEIVEAYDEYLQQGGKLEFETWQNTDQFPKEKAGGFLSGYNLKKTLAGIPLVGKWLLKMLAAFMPGLKIEEGAISEKQEVYEKILSGENEEISEEEETSEQILAEDMEAFADAIDKAKLDPKAPLPPTLLEGGAKHEDFLQFLSSLDSDHFKSPLGEKELELFAFYSGEAFGPVEDKGKKFKVTGTKGWFLGSNERFEKVGTVNDSEDTFFGWLQKKQNE